MSLSSVVMVEEWRPVVGYEEKYIVSESGEVKSLFPGPKRRNRTMGSIPDSKGYLRVGLSLGCGMQRRRRMHILVAEAYIGARPVGMEINHKDGNKRNNHWSNLEYVTPSENARHRDRMGLRPDQRGETHGMSKMTNEKVIDLRRRYAAGEKRKDLAYEYGIDITNVWLIATGRAWAHVP